MPLPRGNHFTPVAVERDGVCIALATSNVAVGASHSTAVGDGGTNEVCTSAVFVEGEPAFVTDYQVLALDESPAAQ